MNALIWFFEAWSGLRNLLNVHEDAKWYLIQAKKKGQRYWISLSAPYTLSFGLVVVRISWFWSIFCSLYSGPVVHLYVLSVWRATYLMDDCGCNFSNLRVPVCKPKEPPSQKKKENIYIFFGGVWPAPRKWLHELPSLICFKIFIIFLWTKA